MRSVDSSVIKYKAKIFAVYSTTRKDPNSHMGEGKSELKSAESMVARMLLTRDGNVNQIVLIAFGAFLGRNFSR